MSNSINNPPSPLRVVLAVDHPGWAFHNIAQQVQAHMISTFAEPMLIDIALADDVRNAEADLCVVLPWKSALRVVGDNRFRKVIVCMYDHVSWAGSEQTARLLRMSLERVDAVGVANERLGDELRHQGFGNKPTFLIEDGVDREMFAPLPMPPRFAVGWVGNSGAGHHSIKGYDLIRKACEITKTELRTADLAGGQPIPHHQMPSWYAGVSTVVCASTSEGTPNPPLEAMACGRPVITTRVGIMPRVVSDGISGVFIERTVKSIADAIEQIRDSDITAMGKAARDAIEPHAWGYKTVAWRSMLRAVLGL